MAITTEFYGLTKEMSNGTLPSPGFHGLGRWQTYRRMFDLGFISVVSAFCGIVSWVAASLQNMTPEKRAEHWHQCLLAATVGPGWDPRPDYLHGDKMAFGWRSYSAERL